MNEQSFNKALKALRNKRKLNQGQVAKCLNLSRPSYCHYESGLRRPTIDTVFRMSALFDVDPMYLFLTLIPENLEKEFPGYFKKTKEQYCKCPDASRK